VEIAIAVRRVELSEELRELAQHKVEHAARYLEGLDRAEVRFFEEHNPRIAEPVGCELTVAGQGRVVRVRATGPDARTALERASDKLAYQLRRLKERLVGRSHPRRSARALGEEELAAGVAPGSDGRARASLELADLSLAAEAGSSASDGREDLSGPDGERVPRIVRTKRFEMKPMTPEEAVLQMELLSHDFFFFANAETGRPAVLYRRRDGDYGLIDAT
jgi:putative sigma-54 modulation protein